MSRFLLCLTAGMLVSVASQQANAVLVAHWTLDGSSPYTEEVSGNSTITVDSGLITNQQPGIAPDGGDSVLFTRDDPDTFIDAGTIRMDGTYVPSGSSSETDYRVLGGQYSITAWINLSENQSIGGDRVIFSNQFSATQGMLFGVNNGNGPGGNRIFVDFGNISFDSSISLEENKDYFVALVADTSNGVDTVGGGTNRARVAVYDVDADTWTTDESSIYRNYRLLNMAIGFFRNGGREFEGNVDDLRLHDNAFTLEELEDFVSDGPTFLDGDFNGDLSVGSGDFALLLANWGNATPPVPAGWDGAPPTAPEIASDEFSRLLSTWGQSNSGAISASAVPEPGSILLLVSFAGLGLIGSRLKRN